MYTVPDSPTIDYSATREQIRELDRLAIDEFGVKGLILMENAGTACANQATQMLDGARDKNVAVFCGEGNNGGDGFVIARHLANQGANVRIYLLGAADQVLRRGKDAATNLQIALNMGIPLRELHDEEAVRAACGECRDADLIVDAMLGTGARGEARQPYLCAIEALNALGRPLLAVDVPSGLDCNSGEPLGAAVHADRTVTFALNKRGFTRQGAEQYTGRVTVAQISIPRRVIERMVARWRSEEP